MVQGGIISVSNIIDGKNLTKVYGGRENIGFVYQQFHLFPQLTVYQNVILPAMIKHDAGCTLRAMELLEYLESLTKRMPCRQSCQEDSSSGRQSQGR